jgi:hypothetical protein
MQTALNGVADVHAWTLPNCFQTLQFVDLSGVIFLLVSYLGLGFFRLFGGV